MCFTKNEILELNRIIQSINSFNSENDIETYLKNQVEDVELFIATLKTINKSKLVKPKRKKQSSSPSTQYTKAMVIKIFEENKLEDIEETYSKQELTEMYFAIYASKPLSSYDKTRIAQNIYQHIYTINRTKALLS